MPITESIIEQVEKMAIKDGVTKGLSFKNRKVTKYKFDNAKDYEMLVEPEDPTPYPDIPAKAPGTLTEREKKFGVDDVVQEEMEQMDKERAMLTAENSGLDFSSMPERLKLRAALILLLDKLWLKETLILRV
jgi:hypothetical protein